MRSTSIQRSPGSTPDGNATWLFDCPSTLGGFGVFVGKGVGDAVGVEVGVSVCVGVGVGVSVGVGVKVWVGVGVKVDFSIPVCANSKALRGDIANDNVAGLDPVRHPFCPRAMQAGSEPA